MRQRQRPRADRSEHTRLLELPRIAADLDRDIVEPGACGLLVVAWVFGDG